MALDAYLTIKGQKSGDIKGSVTKNGREGSILVQAVDHSIVSARDPQSGLPTGQRTHKPFVIIKQLDKSTPVLYNVFATNENITEFALHFWAVMPRPTNDIRTEVQDFTISLINASIASIELKMSDTFDPSTASFPVIQEIAFTYQKIEWTWNDGGITASDDWEARV